MHIHLGASAMLDAVKSESLHDRVAIFGFEAADSSAQMIHQEPADDIVLVAQSGGMDTVGNQQQARVLDGACSQHRGPSLYPRADAVDRRDFKTLEGRSSFIGVKAGDSSVQQNAHVRRVASYEL